jgi:hypothetical protein
LGHRGVDTDTARWSHWVTLSDGASDWVWREDVMTELLDRHVSGHLFVAGCKSNQPRFYPRFDHIVLLSAPAELMMTRIAARPDNPYGKSPSERERILRDLAEIEPLLRAVATAEIDSSAPLDEVVGRLAALADR